jgi:hypothetical protein
MEQDILKALIQWRDAREAIFLSQLAVFDPAAWARLALAEHELMRLARAIPPSFFSASPPQRL